MTVAEFEDWQPPGGWRWQLVDGEPVCMAPPSADHGVIQMRAGYLLTAHLDAHRPGCRVLIGPGVIPAVHSHTNERIPDLAVTCSPIRDPRRMIDPVLLIEILSPSNAAQTRSNVWAYCTIPSVQEILLLSSTGIQGELMRRGVDGLWPEQPDIVNTSDMLRLGSIGFNAPLQHLYIGASFAA